MHRNYDFSGGVGGKHRKRHREGTNLIVLAPDVQRAFPNAVAVNEALRGLIRVAKRSTRMTAVQSQPVIFQS